MTKTTKPKKPTRAELARKVKELEAQLAFTYHNASLTISKAGDSHMASGVLVQLHSLGGKEITPPFVVRDGLSQETINALHADIVRSWEIATMFKPKGVN